MALITIIIPHRKDESFEIAAQTLAAQTFKDIKIYPVEDSYGKGASWARNLGFAAAPKAKYTLFSDNDIEWEPDALENMLQALDKNLSASYAYGWYEMDGVGLFCWQEYDYEYLKVKNFISTMSLVRTGDLPEPPFDENLKRLQDWDLWLTMAEVGKKGVNCGDKIFRTEKKDGITWGGESYEEAKKILFKKHNLERSQ